MSNTGSVPFIAKAGHRHLPKGGAAFDPGRRAWEILWSTANIFRPFADVFVPISSTGRVQHGQLTGQDHRRLIAPTLRVVAPRQTLRVACWVTQSVTECIPTQSVGTTPSTAPPAFNS